MEPKPLIHIVEDDVLMCRSLAHLFASINLEAQCHYSPLEFLAQFEPNRPGCVVIDLRLPGMSGLELHARMRERNWSHPIIFLTGHADVQTAVRAMKAGAVDFIQKPFNEQVLVETVTQALTAHVAMFQDEERLRRIQQRLESLSPREREVLDLVIEGKPTKQIAAGLGLSHKTVDNHRANILDKMEARGVVELVRLVLAAQPGLTRAPLAWPLPAAGTVMSRAG